MDQLVVLGNGFDLARDMKTSLSDYLNNSFSHEELQIFKSQVIQFARGDTSGIDEFKNTYSYFKESGFTFFDFLMLAYSKFGSDSLEKIDWQDVEGIISFVVKSITRKDRDSVFKSEPLSVTLFRYFSTNNKLPNDVLTEISIMISNNYVSKLEIIIYRYLAVQDMVEEPSRRNLFVIDGDLDVEFILDRVWKELVSFEAQFNDYLANKVETEELALYRKTKNYDFVQNMVYDAGFLGQDQTNISTNILNFNYTESNIDNNRFNLGVEKHVHGYNVKREDGENDPKVNIIFGIDNSGLDSQKPEEYRFSKAYRTFQLPSKAPSIYNRLPSLIFNDDYQVVKFFGHGLGLADRTYFFQIFDNINLFDTNQNVKLIFYVKPYGSLNAEKVSEIEYIRVSKLINSYALARSERNLDIELLSSLVMRNQIEIRVLP